MYAERKLGVIAFAAVYRRATREGTNRTLSCLTHTHTEELWVMSRMSMSHGRRASLKSHVPMKLQHVTGMNAMSHMRHIPGMNTQTQSQS